MASDAIARPRDGINHVIAYGQSLSTGWEGWPALSVTPRHDSLMLGNSVRSRREGVRHWVPLGKPELQPLRATVQDANSAALLTPEQVAALPAGALALGETVLEAAVNIWRGRMLSVPGMAARRLLASACGTGGRTLEQLSKGAEPELFKRLRDCAAAGRAAAAASGNAYGVAALLFLQGEANSWGLNGGTADRLEYKALLTRFRADFMADIVAGIARQAEPPAMFLYQTSGAYASDDLGIAQAQLEMALETPGCFLAAPVYPVTDKPSGHLDANGYRWLGSQFGKVMHRVLTLGEDWKPLHPLHAERSGRTVLASFHVPVAPLRWGRPCRGHALVDIAERGFTVLDESGVVPVTSVELEGPRQVRITLERPPTGAARLLYADRRHLGRGCLHDSDAEHAEDCYEISAGPYPSAAIPELIGRPYPLVNWCVAFNIGIAPEPYLTWHNPSMPQQVLAGRNTLRL